MDLKDERDAQDERERIGRLRNLAMEMLQEMTDQDFETWWDANHVNMDEVATSGISTAAALMNAPEDVFHEWLQQDENEEIPF